MSRGWQGNHPDGEPVVEAEMKFPAKSESIRNLTEREWDALMTFTVIVNGV